MDLEGSIRYLHIRSPKEKVQLKKGPAWDAFCILTSRAPEEQVGLPKGTETGQPGRYSKNTRKVDGYGN